MTEPWRAAFKSYWAAHEREMRAKACSTHIGRFLGELDRPIRPWPDDERTFAAGYEAALKAMRRLSP